MYKKVKVVMLPNNKASKIYLADNGKLCISEYAEFSDGINQNQHLYILSDDEIKSSDWFWKPDCNMVFQAEYTPHKSCKKVIASTDESLKQTIIPDIKHFKSGVGQLSHSKEIKLPQPSEQFIEYFIKEYNKGNVIKEVEVEYYKDSDTGNNVLEWEVFKINSDNTINIKPIKDSYTREEVIKILYEIQKYNFDEFSCNHIELDEWIKENL